MDASKALGVPVGAIVKTLIFIIQNDDEVTPIVCLISGDMLCDTSQISQVLNIDGKVKDIYSFFISVKLLVLTFLGINFFDLSISFGIPS